MAIDYGNYAALQGAKPDLSSVQQGIKRQQLLKYKILKVNNGML